MRYAALVVIGIIVLLISAGCIFRPQNQEITVTGQALDHPDITGIGSIDMYALQFRIENPSNRTFTSIGVTIDVNPLLTYCHPATRTFEYPSLAPGEKRTVHLPVTEFNGLDCQYSYTYSVVSDP